VIRWEDGDDDDDDSAARVPADARARGLSRSLRLAADLELGTPRFNAAHRTVRDTMPGPGAADEFLTASVPARLDAEVGGYLSLAHLDGHVFAAAASVLGPGWPIPLVTRRWWAAQREAARINERVIARYGREAVEGGAGGDPKHAGSVVRNVYYLFIYLLLSFGCVCVHEKKHLQAKDMEHSQSL
jgi:hypothetical protein